MTSAPFESSSITLSRTLAPETPQGFLRRRHLYPLLENPAPGTTMLIAPAGYGKTTLVAEWTSQYKDRLIWLSLTESDLLDDMARLFIQATRNLIPGFGPWFEENQPMLASDVVRRWSNDLLALKKEFIFVLDNVRENYVKDVEIANKLIEQFPTNVHFVLIRRTPIESLYDTCIARGEVKILGVNELRFSELEIEQLASIHNLDVHTEQVKKATDLAHGWPSATSLILHQLARNPSENFEEMLSVRESALSNLARLTFKNLPDNTRSLIEKLSIVDEFDHELAHVILGDDYSFESVSELASQGEVLTQSREGDYLYLFSPLIRQTALESLSNEIELKKDIHHRVAEYYESKARYDVAMDHYFASGNQARVSKLFRDASRVKQAQGKGGDLIRWAEYAAMSPVDGNFKRLSLIITGHLVNLNFEQAQAAIDQLRLTSSTSQDPLYFQRFAAASQCFIDLSNAKFVNFDKSVETALSTGSGLELDPQEHVMVLRLAAAKHLIFDEGEKLQDTYRRATEAAAQSHLETTHAYLASIKAMSLLQMSEYKQAFEVATSTLKIYQEQGITGLQGPLELQYVIGRCLHEFARHSETHEQYRRMSDMALRWKQWHWYFISEGFFVRDLATRNNFAEAKKLIIEQRAKALSMPFSHQLDSVIDLADLFLQYELKDWKAFQTLIDRSIQNRFTRYAKQAYLAESGKGVTSYIPVSPSNQTGMDLIFMHLSEAEKNIDNESKALEEMRKALAIGMRTGAREIFLRQGPALGSLILKIANETPTVYNEDLARAMAERIREREMSKPEAGQALTRREQEILRHLSTGRTLTVIAAELHISQNTMKTHLKNLYRKIGAENRDDAVAKAKERFLL